VTVLIRIYSTTKYNTVVKHDNPPSYILTEGQLILLLFLNYGP